VTGVRESAENGRIRRDGAITGSGQFTACSDGYNPGARTLRELRHQRGVSLRDLEQQTGINRAAWSQIEHGRLLPDPRHLAALSAALDVPYEAWVIRFSLEAEETSAA
jgi:ribosome-binding protein aMBF1 (putative translation factor)